MKTICIIAFICVATIYAAPSKTRLSSQAVLCEKELNVNLEFFEDYLKQLEAGETKPTEDFYNLLACVLAKQTDATLGDKNIHDSFIRQITEGDKSLNLFKDKTFTRQDLENVANKCAQKGLDDVGYLKCIKILEPPFVSVLLP